jgi:hypothetical protein
MVSVNVKKEIVWISRGRRSKKRCGKGGLTSRA